MDARTTAAVAAIARAQHGLVTRSDVLGAGASATMAHRWTREGRLERVHTGVYRVAGAPPSWEQALLAAVLAAGDGALASHLAAAALWGLVEERPGPEVTVDRGRLPRLHGVVVHRSKDVGEAARSRRRGVPVTDPLRTVVDLGAVAPRWVVEEALDRGLARQLFSIAAVERARGRVAKPGRRGSGVLREVLERRALQDGVPDSVLEPRMARLLERHGLPPAAFQHEVRRHGRFVARIDVAYPDARLAVEADGYGSHATRQAHEHDLARQNAVVLLRWDVLRFTWADVTRRPGRVAAEIREALGTSTSDMRTWTCPDGLGGHQPRRSTSHTSTTSSPRTTCIRSW